MTPADALTQPALWPLTTIVFLPALVAAVLALPIIPKAREEAIRWITLATTVVVFVLSLWMAWPTLFGAVGPAQFTVGEAGMQAVVKRPWIPAFNIEYLLGVDGICIIAHGGSSPIAVKNAIRVAGESITTQVNPHIIREARSYNESTAPTTAS